jgi:hypothetical protein
VVVGARVVAVGGVVVVAVVGGWLVDGRTVVTGSGGAEVEGRTDWEVGAAAGRSERARALTATATASTTTRTIRPGSSQGGGCR